MNVAAIKSTDGGLKICGYQRGKDGGIIVKQLATADAIKLSHARGHQGYTLGLAVMVWGAEVEEGLSNEELKAIGIGMGYDKFHANLLEIRSDNFERQTAVQL